MGIAIAIVGMTVVIIGFIISCISFYSAGYEKGKLAGKQAMKTKIERENNVHVSIFTGKIIRRKQ